MERDRLQLEQALDYAREGDVLAVGGWTRGQTLDIFGPLAELEPEAGVEEARRMRQGGESHLGRSGRLSLSPGRRDDGTTKRRGDGANGRIMRVGGQTPATA